MDTTLIVVLVALALAVVIGGFIVFLRSRKPKEEPVYHFYCDGCKRKLKYTARQAGHAGMSPQCKKPLKFPAVPIQK